MFTKAYLPSRYLYARLIYLINCCIYYSEPISVTKTTSVFIYLPYKVAKPPYGPIRGKAPTAWA